MLHSLLTDSCAACFTGFYTSNSSVYYDCGTSWIYYFSPEYVTGQPTWNGGSWLNLHHNFDVAAGIKGVLAYLLQCTLRPRRSKGLIAPQATFQLVESVTLSAMWGDRMVTSTRLRVCTI